MGFNKYAILALVLIIMVFSMVGCEDECNYRFLHDESSIITIEIVKVGAYDQVEELFNTETMYCVNDIELFLTEFKTVKCYLSRGAPQGVHENDILLKICYENGDYELIDKLGQAEFTAEKNFKNYTGNFYFDCEAFDKFVMRYIN